MASSMHERDAQLSVPLGQRTWAGSVAYLHAKWYWKLDMKKLVLDLMRHGAA